MNSALGSSVEPDLGPGIDFVFSAPFTETIVLGLGNLTVVEVDPAGQNAVIRWEAVNKRDGSALHVPYEVIIIRSPSEHHTITDRAVGNCALSIDGEVRGLEAGQRLRLTLGQGVSTIGGFRTEPFPGDYAQAMKFYECSYQRLNPTEAYTTQPRKQVGWCGRLLSVFGRSREIR